MSGVVRGVGKVFKRVASGVSKILPIALATGAVLFTAGSALGITSSWGDAVKGVTDSLGAGSTLSNVISGAVENAGYGAVAGAATSALSGGSAMEGAQYGAAAGAVLGGAKGAYDSYSGSSATPATAATEGGGASTGARVDTSPPASDATRGSSDSILRANQPTTGPTTSTTSPTSAATGAPAGTTSAAANPGILDKGGWLERNGTLAGNALKGLGSGLAAADGDAQAKALQQRAEIVRANYGGRTGLLTASNAAQTSAAQAPGMTPQQRFSQAGVQGQYVYDQATGRYVLVQQQATA